MQGGWPPADPVEDPAAPRQPAEADPGQVGLRRRRLRDMAVLLPAAGAFLLLPPFIHVFTGGANLFGIPLIVVYLFGVWTGLILLARILARRLDRSGDED